MPTASTSAGDKADTGYDQIQNDLKALREDIVALASDVRQMGVEQAAGLLDRVRSAAVHLEESARTAAKEAQQRGEQMAGELDRMIAVRPVTSLLVALGVGFVVGAIARR